MPCASSWDVVSFNEASETWSASRDCRLGSLAATTDSTPPHVKALPTDRVLRQERLDRVLLNTLSRLVGTVLRVLQATSSRLETTSGHVVLATKKP